MTKLTLEEYDYLIARHLHMIEAGAEMCQRHAEQLVYQPDFETRCADYLKRCEQSLNVAITRVALARRKLEEKPHAS